MLHSSTMKSLINMPYRDYELEQELRVTTFRSIYGCFLIPVQATTFRVIASNYMGWEHVSVSHPDRCPTWDEMVAIKEIFFNEGEITFQVHPEKKNYVNISQTCLHMWRETNSNVDIPDISKVLNRFEFFSKSPVEKVVETPAGKAVVIYNPTWATWNSICAIKQKHFGDAVAVHYNVSRTLDLNQKHIILLWEYRNNFKLPPKELVF